MEARVEVRGAREARRAMAALPRLVERRVAPAGLGAAAGVVRDEARANAPVRTGALRDSIAAETDGPEGARVVAAAPHAHLVEFGTARTPARPFFEPAAMTRGRQARAAMAAMRTAFGRLGRLLRR